MAHDLDFSTGKLAMAYVGKLPWHELGSQLKAGAPIETWIKAARLNWSLISEPVLYRQGKKVQRMEDYFVLTRSDTGAALSIVSKGYLPVQPKQVLEFYRDLTKDFGYSLETAGALNGGRTIWALAKTGYQAFVGGNNEDAIAGYLLLATSCDKSIATTATFTSIRVVCQNTLHISLAQDGKTTRAVTVPHHKLFDPGAIKHQLGLADERWQEFIGSIRRLAEFKVDDALAEKFFEELLQPAGTKEARKPLSLAGAKEHQRLMSAYRTGTGQAIATAKGTAWGLVNAVSFHVDHIKPSASPSARLSNAWFGSGSRFKRKAWDQAIELAVIKPVLEKP